LTLGNVRPDAAAVHSPPISIFFGCRSRKGRLIGETVSMSTPRLARK
jgi:hypothetical protein